MMLFKADKLKARQIDHGDGCRSSLRPDISFRFGRNRNLAGRDSYRDPETFWMVAAPDDWERKLSALRGGSTAQLSPGQGHGYSVTHGSSSVRNAP